MNSKDFLKIASVALVVSLGSIGLANARGPQVSVQDVQGSVQTVAAITPLSMQFFCAKNRNECRGGGSGQITMTPDLMAVLKQINTHVNRSIRPKFDTADTWTLNPAEGDCEDYVLTKRSLLIRNGVSAGSLRIAYTHTRRGEPHAVLVIRTSEGDFVLDNLNNSVKTLRASGYTIRSMSTANPNNWSAG